LTRALTTASREEFLNPGFGFNKSQRLLTPRGVLWIARADQMKTLHDLFVECKQLVDTLTFYDKPNPVIAQWPIIKTAYLEKGGGFSEPDAMDIDVNATHTGFLNGAKLRGADIRTNAEVTAIERLADRNWKITSNAGTFETPVVINSAGAWSDVVGKMAGCKRVGLVPKRRTVIIFDPPADPKFSVRPMIFDAGEEFYFKPDAGRVLASPADETPQEPNDAQPDELDVALVVDRLQMATTMSITRINHRWAGLRSFVKDKEFVVGEDSLLKGFFWACGQGGYGIQTCFAAGRLIGALASGASIPSDLQTLGVVNAHGWSPLRLQK